MKEELIRFKNLVKEYNTLFNDFSNKRTLFNLKVEDLCEDYNYNLYRDGLSDEELIKYDHYSKAKKFFGDHLDIIKGLDSIRKNNLNKDKKNLNLLYIRYLNKTLGFDYETSYFYSMNYLIYESAGFYKTLSCDSKCESHLRRISKQVSYLKQMGITSVDNMLGDLKSKIEPYTSDTKSSVDKVKSVTQPIVHYGSKTLAKVFTKISDITKKKN